MRRLSAVLISAFIAAAPAAPLLAADPIPAGVAVDPEYADDPKAASRLMEAMRAAAKACDRAEYDRLGHQMQILTAMERSNPAGPQPRLPALEWALSHQPFYPSRCALEAASSTTECPDGGGLLAGALNRLLGTDLAGVCQGKQIHGHDEKGPRPGGELND